MNRILYAIHRWVSLIALLQMGAWVGTGLFFTIVPIERVRGLHEELPPVGLAIDDGAGLISPATAIGIARAEGGMPIVESLELRVISVPSNNTSDGGGPVYIAKGPHHTAVRIAARTGARFDVARGEAEAIARRDQAGAPSVRAASLIERERDAPGVEYRGKPLPAWRVELNDNAGTAVWIDARTGDITARRTDLWRTYDFLWSLHIMDYRGHERFNHPLLTVAAIIAALGIVSGTTLWITRLRRRFLQKKNAGKERSVARALLP